MANVPMQSSIRPMTAGEESRLAMVVLYRDIFGIAAGEWMAEQQSLPEDLLKLAKGGIICGELNADGLTWEWFFPETQGNA